MLLGPSGRRPAYCPAGVLEQVETVEGLVRTLGKTVPCTAGACRDGRLAGRPQHGEVDRERCPGAQLPASPSLLGAKMHSIGAAFTRRGWRGAAGAQTADGRQTNPPGGW